MITFDEELCYCVRGSRSIVQVPIHDRNDTAYEMILRLLHSI